MSILEENFYLKKIDLADQKFNTRIKKIWNSYYKTVEKAWDVYDTCQEACWEKYQKDQNWLSYNTSIKEAKKKCTEIEKPAEEKRDKAIEAAINAYELIKNVAFEKYKKF